MPSTGSPYGERPAGSPPDFDFDTYLGAAAMAGDDAGGRGRNREDPRAATPAPRAARRHARPRDDDPGPPTQAPRRVELDDDGPDGVLSAEDARPRFEPQPPPPPELPAARDELHRVRFREKFRGYHPDDVDAFVERMAVVLEDLESRLADAEARLEDADAKAAVATAGEHTVRRTLTLAQRTAELAIAEAQERAARMVAEAQAEADERIRAAEDEAAQVREREAGRLEADLARLDEATARARGQLDELETKRAQEHARLTALLGELQLLVEDRLAPPS